MVETAASSIDGADHAAAAVTPAWPYQLSRLADRLPVPAIWLYIAIFVVGTPLIELRYWVPGRIPVGTFEQNSLTFGVLLPTILYFSRYLERSANAAFERFRPALEPHADGEAIRRELAILPASIGLAALAAAILLTALRYTLDPASSEVAGLPLWAMAIAFVFEVVNEGALFAFIIQMVRQTAAIRRVLANDTVVDIYRPGPLHALAGLSARMGIALVLMTGAVSLSVAPGNLGNAGDAVLTIAPFVVLPIVLSVLTFVVPLYGTHNRLVDEKQRLEVADDARLQGLVTEINGLIDARRLTEVDPLNKALGAVVQQRDLVARLSTWPWSSGTARALLTAILLPVMLFLAEHIAAQGLGVH